MNPSSGLTDRAEQILPEDLAEQLIGLIEQAAAISRATTDNRTRLASIDLQRKLIAALTNMLGIDSTEMPEVVSEARSLLPGVYGGLRDFPEAAVSVARHIDANGEPALAARFTQLAEHNGTHPHREELTA